MRKTYTIRGVLTLTAPAHQSSPDKSGNHTPLMSTKVMTDDGPQVIPVITGNSVRGVMRRLAAHHVMDALRRQGCQIPRDLYLSVARGAYSRTGMKTGDATVQEIAGARGHVFAGLWGGGARMFPARIRMESDLLPMVAETSGLLPTKLRGLCHGSAIQRNAEGAYRGSAITSQVLLTGRDDMAGGKGADVIENYADAYVEYMANVMGKAALKKGQKAAQSKAKAEGVKLIVSDEERAKADSLATFATLDVINPGTRLYFGMRLMDVTQAQLGLALMAVEDWSNLNALGGGSVRGRGSFKASLALELEGAPVADELLVGEAPHYALVKDTLVQEAVRAAQAELDAITPETLGLVFPVTTEPEAEAA